MQQASPKPSAMMVATLRAAHQLLDAPPILDDPLALRILGAEQEAAVRAAPERFTDPFSTALRTILVVRSRLAEDVWHAAQRRGVAQHVILGAGLDTSAYRATLPAAVHASTSAQAPARLFEVDLPATQAWKRSLLADAGIAAPAALRYVGIDFTGNALADGLAQAGFDRHAPACFTWLGVTLYLERNDVERTLAFIASCAPGSSVVFDYVMSPALLEPPERAAMAAISASLAKGGEPWKSDFGPADLERMLRAMGYGDVAHYGRDQLTQRYLSGRNDELRLAGTTGMVHATVGPAGGAAMAAMAAAGTSGTSGTAIAAPADADRPGLAPGKPG